MEQVFSLSMTACPFSEQRSQHTTDIPLLRARGAPPLPFSAETFSLKPEQQLHLKKVQNKALMSTWRAFFPAFNKILSHHRLLTYWCLTPERFTARHNPLTGSMQICGDGPQGCKTDTFFCSVAPGWLWGYFFYLGGGGKAALDEGIVGIRGVQQFCSGSFFLFYNLRACHSLHIENTSFS